MDQDLYALLVERTPDALIIVSPDGNVLFWNAGAEHIFGYPSEAAIDHPLAELITPTRGGPTGLSQCPINCDEPLASYQPVVCRRRDGTLLYASLAKRDISSLPDHSAGMLYRYTDVTRIKVRSDSRMIEVHYRSLLDSMPDAVVISNEAGYILLVNAQAEALFGYTREELIGHTIEMLLPERFRSGHVARRLTYFKQARPRPMGLGLDLYARRRDGSEFPVEISLSPIDTEVGRLSVGAIRDITERKMFEVTLQEKNAALERADKAKDRFLATMSHELRTPLNAIIGFTSLMLMRLPGPLTSDQENQLQSVQISGRHLLSLINDLLDLAKIESGSIQLTIESVDWRTVAQDVCGSLRSAAESKGLTLAMHLPDNPVVHDTDRRAVQQILTNLAGNAIKYTDSGSVTIDLAVCLHEGSRRIELSVTDTGRGISEEDQARLFQAFVRVGDPQSQQRHEGTGLGLYLCKNLSNLLGGDIEIQSTAGHGSRFALVVPC